MVIDNTASLEWSLNILEERDEQEYIEGRRMSERGLQRQAIFHPLHAERGRRGRTRTRDLIILLKESQLKVDWLLRFWNPQDIMM